MSATQISYEDTIEHFKNDLWWQHPNYPLQDWRHEVAEDSTRQSYQDWVLHQMDPENGPSKTRLHIIAGIINHIWQSKIGDVWTASPCDELSIKVEIVNTNGHAGVVLNGKHCGNRHGGVRQFCNMISRVRPEIVMDVYGEDYEIPDVHGTTS